jgi:uncharacterized protein (DUF697 family)
MGKLDAFAKVWKNLQELDLRPIRGAAERDVRIAIVGQPGSGRHSLAEQLRNDPARPQANTQTPILIAAPEDATEAKKADLIILMLSSIASDDTAERALANDLGSIGKKVLVFHNQFDQAFGNVRPPEWATWGATRAVSGQVTDRQFLEDSFAPLVLEMLPGEPIALARRFPLFRLLVARHLINDACMTNATYSLGAGLAGIVPVLDLPLNVADIFVLTKGQALLVYKLGLALGLPGDWQYYMGEFGGVLGGGFLWRQLARSAVGFIPGWGILPQVAIAYSGTYVVGEVVLQWYLTGRHVTKEQMQEMYRQAFVRGKVFSDRLLQNAPRLHLPALPALHSASGRLNLPRLSRKREDKLLPAPVAQVICPACGRPNDDDAAFCKHCGHALRPAAQAPAEQTPEI